MTYESQGSPPPLVTCPYCSGNAFDGKSESEVIELLNLTGKNRQLVTCGNCGKRFLVRKDQADDFAVKIP